MFTGLWYSRRCGFRRVWNVWYGYDYNVAKHRFSYEVHPKARELKVIHAAPYVRRCVPHTNFVNEDNVCMRSLKKIPWPGYLHEIM